MIIYSSCPMQTACLRRHRINTPYEELQSDLKNSFSKRTVEKTQKVLDNLFRV